MRSFLPSLSFLLYVLCLGLTDFLTIFNEQALTKLALAAEVPVDFVHGLPFRASHRRYVAEANGPTEASSDLILYPGRRAAGATFTNFVTGLGACGGFNIASDFVVALDMQQFDTGNHCGAKITITAKGKIAQATIVDRCKKCGFNNLDLTDGLYAFFDPTMFGTFEGEWEYETELPPAPQSQPPAQTAKLPKSTSTWALSTSHSPSTSTSDTAPSTVINTSTKSTSRTSTSTMSSASATITAVVNNSTAPSAAPGNIEGIFEAFLSMSGVLMSALSSSD